MTQSHDRRIHADALRRHHRLSQRQRLKRQVGIMLASIALGAIGAPYAMLDKDEQWAIGVFAYARGALWIALCPDPEIHVTYKGAQHRVPARAVVADDYYRGSVSCALDLSGKGGLLAFIGWLSGQFFLRGVIARRRERALRDRVIAGTLVTTEKRLAALTAAESDARALAIGTVPIPSRVETRHMAMIGTTGSGKTTALRSCSIASRHAVKWRWSMIRAASSSRIIMTPSAATSS